MWRGEGGKTHSGNGYSPEFKSSVGNLGKVSQGGFPQVPGLYIREKIMQVKMTQEVFPQRSSIKCERRILGKTTMGQGVLAFTVHTGSLSNPAGKMNDSH